MIERKLYLVRHGERLDSVDRTWRGEKYNPPLSDTGLQQAHLLGDRLKSSPIDLIVSSPYLRALQTANAIAQARHQRFIVDEGVGEWQGKSMMPQCPTLTPPEHYKDDFHLMDLSHQSEVSPIWGESVAQVFERYQKAVSALLKKYDGNILIVGHGRTVTGIAHVLTDKPEAYFQYHLAGLTVLCLSNGNWTIELNSDTAHLAQSIEPYRV
ncbi:MAG: hypothetical protein CUN56_10215 [Phototrophicales bacterium]|nr:MAG: hypothetical protein CUN56_10215 [Phototrophicales bacterium]RMG69928.1 MAG: histidine phosphatase family protein [Chloroflexota bacterium]